MGKEIRVIRFKIMKAYPELDDKDPDMKLFMRTNGDVTDIRVAKKSEWEMPKDYESDSSESEEELNHRESFQQIAHNS